MVARWAHRIVCALVIGSLATVGCSWYCELRTRTPVTAPDKPRPSWPVAVPSGWPQAPDGFLSGSTRCREWTVFYVQASMHENYNIYLNSSGWPFLSMRYTALNHAVLGPPGAGLHQTDGLNLPTRWRRTGEMNILPVAPVAAGFVADTAIYGAIALLLWTGPALLLRVVRQRRVRCAACGYDRRGLAADAKCPECGVTPARG